MNTSDYFKGAITESQVRKRYTELCFQYHPAYGGTEEAMQAINDVYLELLKQKDGEESTGTDGKLHRFYYKQDLEQETIDKINNTLHQDIEGCRLMLVGKWIWIDGDNLGKHLQRRESRYGKHYTAVAGYMGTLKYRYSEERNKLYWRPGKYKGRRSNKGFENLQKKYGYEEISKEN